MQKALDEVGTELGLKITTGRASYTLSAASFKIEVATIGADGANTREATDYKDYAQSFYGLPADSLGKKIQMRGETWTITGMAVKSRKFPILAANASGKVFKFPAESVKRALGINVALGTCSNDNAYDEKYQPIGKCNRPATTQRDEGFGNSTRMLSYCAKCAELIDESRAEMRAEARMS
jgi:hypothetical protein